MNMKAPEAVPPAFAPPSRISAAAPDSADGAPPVVLPAEEPGQGGEMVEGDKNLWL